MIPLKGFQFIGKEELLGAALNHVRSFALDEMCLCRKFLVTLHLPNYTPHHSGVVGMNANKLGLSTP